MPKVNELIYDIREAVRSYTSDSEIDDRYILYLYDIKRAKYLKQDLNNYQKSIDNSIKQTLCVGLEEVSINECDVEYTCGTLLRSKQKLPIPIEMHTKVAITSVKPINKVAIPFAFITREKAAYIQNAPYSKSVYSFLGTDNYLYVYSKSDDFKLLDCVTITGVFEKPLTLSEYKNCCNCDSPQVCFDINTQDYPLQPHYIDLIRDEIVKDLIRTIQIPEDKTNDSTD
jgi:hypothetical protein